MSESGPNYRQYRAWGHNVFFAWSLSHHRASIFAAATLGALVGLPLGFLLFWGLI